MKEGDIKIRSLDEFDFRGKTVLLRLDINSPLDFRTKKIVNDNRIQKSLPSIKNLLEGGARLAILAHQGDTLDYKNLIPLKEHAQRLTELVGVEIQYIDDVAGPGALEAVKALKDGQAVLLGNLRYLTEEASLFEKAIKLKPEEMLDTYLVRNLAPLVDLYVNDAFATAHRNSPSMVAFQEILPSAGGRVLIEEVNALTKVKFSPTKPAIFLLGGAKISDAFSMMKEVLKNGVADKILCCGITGEIMIMAKGKRLGPQTEKYITDRGLEVFIEQAKEYIHHYPNQILAPVDVAFLDEGKRKEVKIEDLPVEGLIMDIGQETIDQYANIIGKAGTIFVNGPAGIFEEESFAKGTEILWQAIAKAQGFSVIGGGETVSAASKFIPDLGSVNYICTGGGAMVRFLSGTPLPLIIAMEKAYERRISLDQ